MTSVRSVPLTEVALWLTVPALMLRVLPAAVTPERLYVSPPWTLTVLVQFAPLSARCSSRFTTVSCRRELWVIWLARPLLPSFEAKVPYRACPFWLYTETVLPRLLNS